MEIDQHVPVKVEKKRRPSFFVKDRTWLNVVLFVVTLVSCFFVGINLSLNYKYAEILTQNGEFSLTRSIVMDPEILLLSVLYAVVLIVILLGHEMGHYLTCVRYRVNATLPFFIPAPTIIGTMGAFIKIRSPITRKHQLFDIGISGPLVSFVLGAPALAVGLYFSKTIPAVPSEGSIIFGEPLFLKMIASLMLRNIPQNFDIVLHPVAFAGWVGILVTALNLFPIGQLDGGHIFYAILGERSRDYGKIFLVVFVVMGVVFWVGWFIWALLISVMGLKHPRLFDDDVPLSKGRRFLGGVILVIFILSFIPDPVKGFSLIDIFNGGSLNF
jgi:Zn-dependent protease